MLNYKQAVNCSYYTDLASDSVWTEFTKAKRRWNLTK